MSQKVLIFFTSVGFGHKTIAENIAESLRRDGHEVFISDALKVGDTRLVRWGKEVHRLINERFPWLWDFFYTCDWLIEAGLKLRLPAARGSSKLLLREIDQYRPDVIVSTQAAPSAAVAYLKSKGLYKGLFGIAFSDFHLHRFWVYDQADFYLANISEQKQEMTAWGISSDKIFLTGFCLPPRPPHNAASIRSRLSIPEGKKVILLSSGSLGIGLPEHLMDRLLARSDWHIVVVCGRNHDAEARLKRRYGPLKNLSILGYVTPMSELYAIADVFLTKPGGLSVAEALDYCLPMIVASSLPGQERLNLSYLLRHKLVEVLGNDVLGQVDGELGSGRQRKLLRSLGGLPRLLRGDSPSQAVEVFAGRSRLPG